MGAGLFACGVAIMFFGLYLLAPVPTDTADQTPEEQAQKAALAVVKQCAAHPCGPRPSGPLSDDAPLLLSPALSPPLPPPPHRRRIGYTADVESVPSNVGPSSYARGPSNLTAPKELLPNALVSDDPETRDIPSES